MSNKRSLLEVRLDLLFSKIIRLRDHGKPCITCGKILTPRNISCGHMMRRRHLATRWHLDNGFGQCTECNIKDDQNLIEECGSKRLGIDTYNRVQWLARGTSKFGFPEMQEMYIQLTNYYNELQR